MVMWKPKLNHPNRSCRTTEVEGGAEQDHKKIFFEVLRVLEKPWHKCIIFGGDYFEGYKIDIYE